MVRGLDVELDERGNIPGLPSFYLPETDKEARREADGDDAEKAESNGEDEATESAERRRDSDADGKPDEGREDRDRR